MTPPGPATLPRLGSYAKVSDGGNPRRRAGDGFPSARERRKAAAHPPPSFPRTETLAQPSSRAGGPLHNRHSRAGGNPGLGSPLGMPAISATLSPSGGVTQRSPQAGIYPRHGAQSRLWTQSITLTVPIRWRIWARGVRFGGQPVTERHRAGETCGAFPVESGDKNLRLRYDGMEWKCEKCGNINPPTRSVFCGKCGKRRDED